MRALLLLIGCLALTRVAGAAGREFYELKIYTLSGPEQEMQVDQFLKNAYLPALNRAGIKHVGVFKPVEDSPDAGKKIYVLIPFKSLKQFAALPGLLDKDARFQADGKAYLGASYDKPPYVRMESVVLQAFKDMPQHFAPSFKTPAAERIYELRSYEGPTEKLYQNKVSMFNEGQEIGIFTRLGFNAVFYAEVLAGSRMPNLMYMTSFENRAARESLWKSFVDDAFWKKISTMPEYQHNVSKADIMLLHPADYSGL